MNFTIVLDISAVIWDEMDYENNKSHYYRLTDGISMLINKLDKEKPAILIRSELKNEIITNFPFRKIPRGYNDFETQTYLFFARLNPIEYSGSPISRLVSIPDQIKAHYNNNTKNEVCCLLSKIHSDSSLQSIYFTFKYLWNGVDKLTTHVNEIKKEYETIISDKKNELDNFFAQFKLIFEHNPKHDKTLLNTKEKWEQAEDKSGFISRLSCYNGKDTIRPQELLDSAYKYGSCYYNFDNENDVYVVFRNTRKNIYHGYDENDMGKIPNEARKHFNK